MIPGHHDFIQHLNHVLFDPDYHLVLSKVDCIDHQLHHKQLFKNLWDKNLRVNMANPLSLLIVESTWDSSWQLDCQSTSLCTKMAEATLDIEPSK